MSNSLGLISAASINESTQLTLNEVKSTAQQYLSQIASSEDFVTKFAIAFGGNFDVYSGLLLRFGNNYVTYFNSMFF
jgi:hypothetical protein